ncbi:hypothetical protein JXA12_03900 [Candidatus Woesearchaeota archaeon]|nr:hypothetical protein [Candidatus Woesearchaeota archaeon]
MFSHFKLLKPAHKMFFSLLIGVAVVAFWRGAWGLMDLYVLPGNPSASFLLSMVAGLAILAITHYWSKELT